MSTLSKKQTQPEIGLQERDMANVSEFLNKLLADYTVLYTKIRHAHWNVEGPDFHAQHLFFETLYDQLSVNIDDVAERVRMLGHYAVGSLAKYLQLTHLSEIQHGGTDSIGLIKELTSDFETVIMVTRSGIELAQSAGDTGTEDFLTGLMEEHEKTAWMLRSHLG
ncbi:DNA starvation/stationary phase protection protein [Sphingobacterium sp. lm-10]|uniref:Dps family protein n=1 Tax=Sphingobacterium sp. lm-10 TaxID=2944904 RepID=UPI0020200BF3|nr:DNA starvation/stationary phase protection protein [Sphingobacterium sp. lm-10]MCL7988231.1 DNA starvation/stationary phase protection protein [Sphingobacterium sp. lm-10]